MSRNRGSCRAEGAGHKTQQCPGLGLYPCLSGQAWNYLLWPRPNVRACSKEDVIKKLLFIHR